MNHEGTAWQNVYLDTSMVATPCAVFGCYGDYFAAQAAIAADAAGNLAVAYTRNDVNGTAHRMFIRSSSDGISWSDPTLFNDQGDSNFPAIVAGTTAGEFPLAWAGHRKTACWGSGRLRGRSTQDARGKGGGGKRDAGTALVHSVKRGRAKH